MSIHFVFEDNLLVYLPVSLKQDHIGKEVEQMKENFLILQDLFFSVGSKSKFTRGYNKYNINEPL